VRGSGAARASETARSEAPPPSEAESPPRAAPVEPEPVGAGSAVGLGERHEPGSLDPAATKMPSPDQGARIFPFSVDGPCRSRGKRVGSECSDTGCLGPRSGGSGVGSCRRGATFSMASLAPESPPEPGQGWPSDSRRPIVSRNPGRPPCISNNSARCGERAAPALRPPGACGAVDRDGPAPGSGPDRADPRSPPARSSPSEESPLPVRDARP
jgi:hypothetical protein